jgi:hypothetical protein
VFLAALGAEETRIEASFREAIRIAKEQKAVSLENAQKQPTRNIAARKRVGQEAEDSDCLFGKWNSLVGGDLRKANRSADRQ